MNDAPTVATNLGVEVEDGRSAPLTGLLVATDIEDDDAGLRYSVASAPIKGRVERPGGPGVETKSFTQAEVDAGQIVYAADRQAAFTTDAFVFSVTDTGGASAVEKTTLIDITVVNVPPVIEVPFDLILDEDTPFLFDNLGIAVPDKNKLIRISDPDAGANDALVSPFATNGDPTLAEPSLVSLVDSDGVVDEDLSFRASFADLDVSLLDLRFTTDPDFVVTASLAFEVSDLGASGIGGPRVVRGQVEILFTPINDAPLIDETQQLFLRSTGVGELTPTILPVRDPKQGSVEITISLLEASERVNSKKRVDPAEAALGLAVRDPARVGDVEYHAEADFWEAALSPLNLESRGAKCDGGLWSKIADRLDEDAAPGTRTIAADKGVWESIARGVERKVTNVNRYKGVQSYLVRMKKGAVLPPHDHPEAEHCVVILGVLRRVGREFGVGAYQYASKDEPHLAILAVEDALFFIRGAL